MSQRCQLAAALHSLRGSLMAPYLWLAFGLIAFAVSLGALIGSLKQMQNYGMRIEAMLAWPAIPGVAYLLAEANFGSTTGAAGACLASVAMLSCFYRPATSKVRVHLLLGLTGWFALATVAGLSFIALIFIKENDLHLMATLREGWPFIIATALTWAARRGLLAYIMWSFGREPSPVTKI